MTKIIDDFPGSATATPSPHGVADFLASHGGPFYQLQIQLGLLKENHLRAAPRALLFIALAWVVPLFLALTGGLSSDHGLTSYLSDIGVWARFVIGVGAFVLAEHKVEKGLNAKLKELVVAPIIAPGSISRGVSVVSKALRRRDLGRAELACVVLAAIASFLSDRNFQMVEMSSWAVVHFPERNTITPVGWWSICFSLPLFVFLFTRGAWRHLVWARLLRDIARLELRLVANHPDGKGGLGFLARYPNTYVLFVLGISCAIAAQIATHFVDQEVSATTLTVVMGGWLVLVLAFFAYPLSAFTPPLVRLKENGLAVFGAQATRYFRGAERKMIRRNIFADQGPEQEDEVADPSKLYDASSKLSTMLISRTAVIPVAAAALFPFAVAGAVKLPFKEVFSVLKKLLIL